MEYGDRQDSGYGEDSSSQWSLRPSSYDHDHISSLEVFSQDLQQAIANSFPRPKTLYTSVHVLLLRWAEDDLNVQHELTTLMNVFNNQYSFATEQWDIPSQSPTRALQTKLYDFQNSHQNEDELLIVYYGGHGDADRRGRSIWAANQKTDSPTLNWSSLQHLLETAIPHVLIILDCCYAANAARDTSEGTTKELLAACGRENPTTGVSDRSFTSALIEELQAFGSTHFTVAMLHSRLVTIRWRLKYTPVYALLSEHGGHSIDLAPQPLLAAAADPPALLGSDMSDDMMDISSPDASTATDTRVLLAISITNDASCDIAQWKKWLVSDCPWDVTKIEVQVEGVYKSHSTMLIMSIPIIAWDSLPNRSAYRFIGFVKSGNLSQELQCSENIKQQIAAIGTKKEQKLQTVKSEYQALHIGTPAEVTDADPEDDATAESGSDSWDGSEHSKSNIHLQKEENKVPQERLELEHQQWDKEKLGLKYIISLANQRLKALQDRASLDIEYDLQQDVPKLEPIIKLEHDLPGSSGPLKSNTTSAGFKTEDQALKSFPSRQLMGNDMKPIAKPKFSGEGAMFPTKGTSTLVAVEQLFRDAYGAKAESWPHYISSSTQTEGISQAERLDPTEDNAAALTSEERNQTKPLASNRKRTYADTGLSPSDSSGKVPRIHWRQASNNPYRINCVCGSDSDDRDTVRCNGCDTWQHADCYDRTGDPRSNNFIDLHRYQCISCWPRQLDVPRIAESQKRRIAITTRDPSLVAMVDRMEKQNKKRGLVTLPESEKAGNDPPGISGGSALQDYQMQLMLLEQHKKKRLLMPRPESERARKHQPGVPGEDLFGPPGLSDEANTAPLTFGPSANQSASLSSRKAMPDMTDPRHAQGSIEEPKDDLDLPPSPSLESGGPPSLMHQQFAGRFETVKMTKASQSDTDLPLYSSSVSYDPIFPTHHKTVFPEAPATAYYPTPPTSYQSSLPGTRLPQASLDRTPLQPAQGSNERPKVHKLTEGRKRETIKKLVNELAEIVPGCDKEIKASILERAYEYIISLEDKLNRAVQTAASKQIALENPTNTGGPNYNQPNTSEPYPSVPWSPAADEQLMCARQQGLNWLTIAETYFPQKTANTCRKRHERLMEKRNAVGDWNGGKFEEVARAYREVREDMWRILADRVNEKWSVVESKCMERGLKNLGSMSRAQPYHVYTDSAIGGSGSTHGYSDDEVFPEYGAYRFA
ncbi:MAG: hypothetical protein Q9226_006266 [Calogaya cf. arnoldii]